MFRRQLIFDQKLLSVGFQETIEQLQNVLKQNNPMGSHIPPGIPPLLAKNWQPVPDHPNSFRNKFTHQYTHKHIINIQSPLQIQSFKFRMKENNPYICRVLFYHQYHDSIYHVYTDQIHMQPSITTVQSWRTHRLKIFESFLKLTEIFGFMKVCRQMIGADTNGNIKVWIHPDPVSGKPWSTCSSEAIMITQIQNILRTVQDRQKNKDKKNHLKSLENGQNQYFSFKQAIEAEKYLLQVQMSRPKSKARSSALNQGLQNQISNTGSSNRKKNMNRTYNFGGKTPQINQFMSSQVPQFQGAQTVNQQTTGFIKQNKLQKLFNPILCQTTRGQDELGKFRQNKNKKANFQRSNFSLERPVSYYHAGFTTEIAKNHGQSSKNVQINQNENKRRETQNFKQIQNMQQYNASVKTEDKYSGKSKTLTVEQQAIPSIIHNKSAKNSEQKQKKEANKNPLNKLFAPAKIYVAPNQIKQQQKYRRENKTSYQGYNQSKAESVSHNIDKGKLSSSKRQYKQIPMPNFLMKSQTEIQKQLLKKQKTTQIHPSTERHPRELGNCLATGIEKNLDKKTANIISTQSIGDHSEGTHSESVDNRVRTNTTIRAKQQLKNLLDIPIEPFHKGKKQEFDKLKSFKTMYVGKKNFESQYESEKDEFEIIKEKVEEKKAKFAQLKNDARKILQDDF